MLRNNLFHASFALGLRHVLAWPMTALTHSSTSVTGRNWIYLYGTCGQQMPYCVLFSKIVSCCVEFLNLQLIRLSPSSHRRLNTAATPDLCISWLFVFPLNHNHLHLRQTSEADTTFVAQYIFLPGARWVDRSTPVWWLTCIYVDQVLCLPYMPCYSTPVGCALAISRPCLRWQIQDWPSPA